MEAAENWMRWNGDLRTAPRTWLTVLLWNMSIWSEKWKDHLIWSSSWRNSHYSDIWVQIGLSQCNFVLRGNFILVCNRIPWSIWQFKRKKLFSSREISRMEIVKQCLERKRYVKYICRSYYLNRSTTSILIH